MKCYVLNLPRCVERRAHVKKQLGKWGVEPIWISGGDRGLMRTFPEDYSPEKAQRDIMRQMGLGEVGCLLGHLRAFQEIIDSEDDWGVILEDDVLLKKNPLLALEGFEGKIVFGNSNDGHRREIKKDFGNGVKRLHRIPYGAFCYAIHRDFAATAIVHLKQGLHIPIDVYFRHACMADPTGFWQVEGVAEEDKIGETSVIGDDGRMWNGHPSLWRKMETHNVCPPLIHQIWIGPKPEPKELGSWEKKNAGRICKLWREEQLKPILAGYGLEEIWKIYMLKGMYAAAADVARYCILHRFGGLYVDADTEALREVDIDSPFFVNESETYRPGLLCNGFIQVKANHPCMEDAMQDISAMNHPVEEGLVWQKLGPGLITEIAKKYPQIDKLPSSSFLPEHFEGPNPKSIKPYCSHEWGSTYKPKQLA